MRERTLGEDSPLVLGLSSIHQGVYTKGEDMEQPGRKRRRDRI